jgi:hypothetical protein
MIGNMNNLIYFSLTWVGMYAREIQSPEHPYHKWFTLHSVALWPKHTTSRVHKLDTPWDLAGTVCPMPEITNNEFDFGRVIESIADDFCQLVKHTGKTPYICWSGGIDSTSILVSILKVAPADILKDLVILCNDRSIIENTYFYYKYIDKKFKIEDIDQLEITSETEDGVIMSLRHKEFDIEGVQFHPESVLTEGGHKMLAEWLVRCGDLDARNLAQGLQPVIPN